MMIDKVRERIAAAIDQSVSPCVLWSGGLDSSVVLTLARQVRPDIDICQFRTDFAPSQKAYVDRIIADEDLKIFSWSPKFRFFAPDGDGTDLALADIYSWGNSVLPVVRSCVKGTRCLLDASPVRTPEITPRWDLFLTGVLGTDREYGLPVATEGHIGPTRLYSPLFDADKEDVKAIASLLGIPHERPDTGTIEGCVECLQSSMRGLEQVWCPKARKKIDSVKWNPDENHELLIHLLTGR